MHPHEGNGSPEDRRLQIAVAGGSIGGLCAGLALHGSGFDVNVYERHPGPMDTRGAGIVVQGELVQLFDTYGAPPLPTTSCRVRRYLRTWLRRSERAAPLSPRKAWWPRSTPSG
jgi:2-polyprenyl-6-methoxyphenol hydroxylase-like FAD-dependent oxidoreductase